MPVGRPPQQETPQIVRQIPRAAPLGPIEASGEPPNDPPVPFFWAPPSEPELQPEPGRLRPIPALIGDTFRFIVRQWRPLLATAAPAAAAVVAQWLALQWAYEQVFDDIPQNTSGLRLALGTALSMLAFALGTHFFSIAAASLVVQRARNDPAHGMAAARMAMRKLPRVTVINLLFGLALAVVYVPLQLLIYSTLLDSEFGFLATWLPLVVGILAYSVPQINVYFTAIMLEDPRPKFRRARYLVRGRRGLVLGRALLCQIVVVALHAVWQAVGPEFDSVAWAVARIFFTVTELTILTTALTLLYVDLAGVSADEAAMDQGEALCDGLEGVGSEFSQRPT
ncbi:hypothetical protein [Candidatus Poriferisodalis sp.]|uniref:hypothetical protein n=1 Tax=Candidatus Poriferisodalis sp. TaxID=3101277 RepID=UPI003B017682